MKHRAMIPTDCTRCRLSASRCRVVSGVGPDSCPIVLVGEAPGRDEDLKGQPFVGRAGRLLTQTLDELGVSRDDVLITNLVKCRPPGNRRPRKDEKSTCRSYLMEEIAAVDAKVICAMGQTVAQDLFLAEGRMSELVGKEMKIRLFGRDYTGVVTYHPAACLYRRDKLPDFKDAIERSLRVAGML